MRGFLMYKKCASIDVVVKEDSVEIHWENNPRRRAPSNHGKNTHAPFISRVKTVPVLPVMDVKVTSITVQPELINTANISTNSDILEVFPEGSHVYKRNV